MTLIALGIAPVAIVLLYVYSKDKYDKEPKKLIFLAMLLGALSCIPAAIIELVLEPIIMRSESTFALFIDAMFGIALVEEGVKLFVLYLLIWKSKYFNERFDGIVYAVSVSLGFAALENVFYVASGGLGVGILRAFTAVPMHGAFGILMGVYYGKAKFVANGKSKYMPMALLVPTVFHGLYDFFALAGETLYLLLFLVLLIAIYIIAFKAINKEAKKKVQEMENTALEKSLDDVTESQDFFQN